MTYEEAKRILHPDTTFDALNEIEYYAGFNGKEARLKAVNEACLVACQALDKQIGAKPIKYDYCPNCNGENISVMQDGGFSSTLWKHCPDCGQKLDWSK